VAQLSRVMTEERRRREVIFDVAVKGVGRAEAQMRAASAQRRGWTHRARTNSDACLQNENGSRRSRYRIVSGQALQASPLLRRLSYNAEAAKPQRNSASVPAPARVELLPDRVCRRRRVVRLALARTSGPFVVSRGHTRSLRHDGVRCRR